LLARHLLFVLSDAFCSRDANGLIGSSCGQQGGVRDFSITVASRLRGKCRPPRRARRCDKTESALIVVDRANALIDQPIAITLRDFAACQPVSVTATQTYAPE
jgi:hypothetical protein